MPAPQPHRLLIVDDDPSIHELVQAMLAGTRWEADSASNGEEALAHLEPPRLSLLRSRARRHPDAWHGRAYAPRPAPDPLSGHPGGHHDRQEYARACPGIAAARSRRLHRQAIFARCAAHNAAKRVVHLGTGDDIKILSDKPNWISLQIRCRLATADRLTQFVRELPSDLDPDQREQIATAFRELLMNAVEHGGHLDPEKTVDLSYIRTARSIVYYIRDPGEGFSMDTLAHAAIANTAEEPFRHVELRSQMGIRPGGFGLLMTKSFADELIYSAKGNEVILIKYL